jgi:hypothetical protein
MVPIIAKEGLEALRGKPPAETKPVTYRIFGDIRLTGQHLCTSVALSK